MREREEVASRLRRGDWVCVRGGWRKVKSVRKDRYATGAPAVVLVFGNGWPLRVPAGELLAVGRRGR